jgi:hypothetical protein
VVVVTVVLISTTGSDKAQAEVALEGASQTGSDPFTASTAEESAPPPSTPAVSTPGASETGAPRPVAGSQVGLYGGTRKVASCDVEKQIDYFDAAPAKKKAFASVLDLQESAVTGYLRGLTPLQLRVDTRVTNHGYRDGAPTEYQAVLQAGTAVLVDNRGMPRVRCACGNPLTQPTDAVGTTRATDTPWPGYRPSNVVIVQPSVTVVNVFYALDPESNDWFYRTSGDTGVRDQQAEPPRSSLTPAPSDSPSSPSPTSPSTSPSESSTSDSPTSGEPDTPTPSSEPDTPTPSSEPATPEPPTYDSSAPEPPESSSSPDGVEAEFPVSSAY